MLNVNPLLRFANSSFDTFCAFWLALVLLTNLPLFLDFYNGTVNAPKFYIITILLGMAYFAIAPARSMKFFKEPVFVWSCFFIIVVLVDYIVLKTGEFDSFFVESELDRLQRIIMFPAIAFICWRMNPKMLWVFLPIACIIIAGSNIYDLLAPGMLGPVIEEVGTGRADGFYRNANPAAEAALMSILVFRNRCPRLLFVCLYIFAGLGIVATFSRSGMILWVAMGIYMSMSGKLPKYILAAPVLAILAVNVFFDEIEVFLHSIPEYAHSADNMVSRLSFFTGGTQGSAVEQVTDDVRGEIAIFAVQSAFEKPLFGHGYDYFDPIHDAGPHNVILSLFHTYGVFGLIVWGWLVACLFREERRQYGLFCAVTAGFVWFSFFSHTMLDNVYWYVVIAISLFAERDSRRSGRFLLGVDMHAGSSFGRKRRKRRRRMAFAESGRAHSSSGYSRG